MRSPFLSDSSIESKMQLTISSALPLGRCSLLATDLDQVALCHAAFFLPRALHAPASNCHRTASVRDQEQKPRLFARLAATSLPSLGPPAKMAAARPKCRRPQRAHARSARSVARVRPRSLARVLTGPCCSVPSCRPAARSTPARPRAVTPGASSRSTNPSSRRRRSRARSVMIRWTAASPSAAACTLEDLLLALGGVLHDDDHPFRAPATRSIAPPMPLTILPGIIQLARSPSSRDLHRAEDAHVDVPAADHGERVRRREVRGARELR